MRIRIAASIAAALVALTIAVQAHAANYTDWWWGGPAQSGQGVNVGQQANTVFVSWFTYDEQGNGMWVVFSGPLNAAGNVVTGALYRTTGPPLGTPFDTSKVINTQVGTATLWFTDLHNARFDWSVNGKSGSLPLVRQTYGASSLKGDFDGYTDGNLHCPGMGYYGNPTDTPVHSSGSISIAVSGNQVTGAAQFDAYTCNWSGNYAQSGQMVHITGSTVCGSPIGAASFDLTLLVVDRAVIGWQKSSSMMSGCTQIEQFSLIRHN